MLASIIKGPSFEKALQEIRLANVSSDLIELRVDCFDAFAIEEMIQLRNVCLRPVILTLRSKSQGGDFEGPLDAQLNLIHKLLVIKPDYIDLEWGIDIEKLVRIKEEYPDLKVILSFHNFEDDSMPAIYEGVGFADVVKVALFCSSTSKAFQFLRACKENRSLGIALGPHGTFGRILSRTFHFPWTYANLSEDEESLGRLSIPTLQDVYGYSKLNPETSIYGLIGDPVDKSIGHLVHNRVMQESGLNAVYLKMKVTPSELPQLFSHLKALPVKGLSVTMPLKEAIIPFLDHIDDEAKKIGAVNTVHFHKGESWGFNTDGFGVLQAIRSKIPDLHGLQVCIMGGGGAARAAGYVLKNAGAHVVFIIREPHKIQKWADINRCSIDHLENWPRYKNADLLINATTICPINTDLVEEKTCVMDMTVRPFKTSLILAAEKRGCPTILGWEMFAAQAAKQQEIWFSNVSPIVYPIVKNIYEASKI